MKVTPINRKDLGFSLVEMLVVIAVIGIISAVAVPTIGKINEASNEAKNKRNAQNIATVAVSARVAGVEFVTDDLRETLENIKTGGESTEGTFEGSFFGMPFLADVDLVAAERYLSISEGKLLYDVNAPPSDNE